MPFPKLVVKFSGRGGESFLGKQIRISDFAQQSNLNSGDN